MTQCIKVLTDLPKVLRDEIGDDDFSLAIDIGMDTFAVIEVTGCVDGETMKVVPTVQRLIERAPIPSMCLGATEFESLAGHSANASISTVTVTALTCQTSQSQFTTPAIVGWISAESQSSISPFATSKSSSTN